MKKIKMHWANLITALLTSLVITSVLLACGIGTSHPSILANVIAFIVGLTFPLELVEVIKDLNSKYTYSSNKYKELDSKYNKLTKEYKNATRKY